MHQLFNLNSSSNPDIRLIWIPSIPSIPGLNIWATLPQFLNSVNWPSINFLNCMRNSLMKLIHSSIASTVFRIYRQVPPYFDACFENDTYSHEYVDGTQLVTGSKQRLLMQQQCCLLSRIFAVMYYLDRHHIG